MTVDVLGAVRLLHSVLGFLVRLSAQELMDIADGRRTLRLDTDAPVERVAISEAAPPEQRLAAPRQTRAKGRPAPDAVTSEGLDYAEVAAKLRGFDTVNDGFAYLSDLRLNGKRPVKTDLIKLGAEMGLTLSGNMRIANLQNRLVNHAIGARKKYAGLTKW